jgi:endonuclease/exonuclease/phosphatase family metal-dependent hydrolase
VTPQRAGCLLVAVCALAACVKAPAEPAPASVTIMTFNVENLFDMVDAPGKNDATYLPRSEKASAEHIAACREIDVRAWRKDCLELDWNAEAVDYKLAVVAEVILQVGDGRGPDIVALQEVENRDILERLRNKYLEPAGYGPSILIEGQDLRGIDVAFLSRLPVVGDARLHGTQFPGHESRQTDSRGVLEATFRLPDGAMLTGYAVHFPAPFHPVEMRKVAYDRLNSLREALPESRLAFAAGDFNTPIREQRETAIFAERVRPYWVIAHELGCGDCRGTYYWATGRSWSFLDMILFSPARGGEVAWRIRKGSVQVANEVPAQTKVSGTPRRFSREPLAGVSDHWPLVLTLEAF